MHNAPSVSYPVGRCAFQRQLYLFFVLFTCSVLGLWALDQGFTWVWGVAALLALFGGIFGALALRFVATLTWDGERWCLHHQSGNRPDMFGDVEVILDTQKTLLLRWQPISDTLPPIFMGLWLGEEQVNSLWHALRCAVYQRKELKEETWRIHWH